MKRFPVDDARTFGLSWFTSSYELYRRGDPLLMGAAIGFNSLFAMVPLAIAFASVVSFIDAESALSSNLIEIIEAALPPEIASFIVGILRESSSVVGGERIAVVIVSLLVALWSGSRAVYALQKSLRLVEGMPDERGYLRTRLVGVGVTVAAIVAVVVGYVAMLIGENAWQEIADLLALQDIGLTRLVVVSIALLWIFGMLWVTYRYGPPEPIAYTTIVSIVVTIVLAGGTAIASVVMPRLGNQTIAVFGSIGVILVWLYFIGVVVVSVPILAIGLRSALHGAEGR